MSRALGLAAQALFLSNPNPRVGCVLVNPNGQIIGEGFTQVAGGPHAEIMALRDAAAKGQKTEGATAYVTLEPCSHTGRTGPCCNALIEAGIQKVVGAITDPNPQVAGQGFAKLRAAGITVEMDDEAGAASRELNIGFFSRMIRGTPWVRMKAATSLDGSTALHNGQSQWITGAEARTDGHAWRARACTVLTGIGTILTDNPRLNVRDIETPRQPKVVIVDSQLDIPLSAHVLRASSGCTIYTASTDSEKMAALQSLDVTVTTLANDHGKVDLAAMLRDIAAHGTNELHIEAGFKLNGSFLKAALVDELLLYLAPKLLGAGSLGMANFGPLNSLTEAMEMKFHDISPIGDDLRIVSRFIGHNDF